MAGLFSFTTKQAPESSRPSGPSRTPTTSSLSSTASSSSASSLVSESSKASRTCKYKLGIAGQPIIPEPWTRPKDVPKYILYNGDGSQAYCDACQKHITMEPGFWQNKGVAGHMSRTRHKCQERFWLARQDVRRVRERNVELLRSLEKGKGRAD